MRWLFPGFLMFACMACNAPKADDAAHISISLRKDAKLVVLRGLDYAILQELKKDSLSAESWQSLFPVYRMPADTDMKDFQPEQPGTYSVNDSLITFKPDTPFAGHQQYFARFYGNGSNFSTGNLVREKTNLKGQGYVEVVLDAPKQPPLNLPR